MTKEEAAIAVAEALRNVDLCAKCYGKGFYFYFDSDGYGADRYDCQCVPVRKAFAEYDALCKKG